MLTLGQAIDSIFEQPLVLLHQCALGLGENELEGGAAAVVTA
jgi:hypothetical protein